MTKKPIGKDFWNSGAVKAVFRADASEEVTLHRPLAKIIRSFHPKRLLDFGCGDGALLTSLDPRLEIHLYDRNLASATMAKQKSQSPRTHLHSSLASIPTNHYDIVVLSFVLICLPSTDELLRVLRRIKSFLRNGGTLIVAECHPCFRDRRFAGHHVAYTRDARFNYNARFHKIAVCLHGYGEQVTFYDYHWTLPDIINTVAQSGLAVHQLHEVRDTDYGGRPANLHFPPYLVICAKK